MTPEACAITLRRIAGANANLRRVESNSALARRVGDSGERRAQVALHIYRQCLKRTDVDDPASFCFRIAVKHEPIEAPEKGRQSFACPGGSKDQRAFAASDCRPTQPLRRGWTVKHGAKPLRCNRMKEPERCIVLRRHAGRGFSLVG